MKEQLDRERKKDGDLPTTPYMICHLNLPVKKILDKKDGKGIKRIDE